jgi:outer membrane immunogenic protein
MRFKSGVFGASVAFMTALSFSNPVRAGGWDTNFFNYGYDYGYDAGVWNKLYVGVHGGGAWGNSDWLSPAPFPTATSPGFNTGAFVGGHVGFLHQFGPLVAGAEVSYSGLENLDGTSSTGCFTTPGVTFSCQNQIDNLLLANGRLGYAFGPLLLYGTGGYARAQFEGSVTQTAPTVVPNERVQADVSGWNAGGGIEFMFTHNVSLAVQFTHVDLNSQNYQFLLVPPHAPGLGDNVRINPDFDIVEARLNILLDTRRDYAPAPLK